MLRSIKELGHTIASINGMLDRSTQLTADQAGARSMPTRRTASLLIITQPEQSRSGDQRQVVSVYPVKWAAIV